MLYLSLVTVLELSEEMALISKDLPHMEVEESVTVFPHALTHHLRSPH